MASSSRGSQCQAAHKELLECPRAVLGKVGAPQTPVLPGRGDGSMVPSVCTRQRAWRREDRGVLGVNLATAVLWGCQLQTCCFLFQMCHHHLKPAQMVLKMVTEVSTNVQFSFFSTFCHWIYHFLSISGLLFFGWGVFYSLYYKETHKWGKQERSKWKTNHRPGHEFFWGKCGLDCILQHPDPLWDTRGEKGRQSTKAKRQQRLTWGLGELSIDNSSPLQ